MTDESVPAANRSETNPRIRRVLWSCTLAVLVFVSFTAGYMVAISRMGGTAQVGDSASRPAPSVKPDDSAAGKPSTMRYGLPDRITPIKFVNEAIAIDSETAPGFEFVPDGTKGATLAYVWKYSKDGTEGKLFVAVCRDREAAELVWQQVLSGFMKFDQSKVSLGRDAKYGDVEFDVGTSVEFLRNNVFCSVESSDGKSHDHLTAAVRLLASRLSAELSRTEKPLRGPKKPEKQKP